MKRVITIASLAALSTAASAFDYKINLEGRADFVNGRLETETGTSAGIPSETFKESYNNFSNGLIRLNMMGNINDNLAYRFRYRFINAAASPISTNSTAANRTIREVKTTELDYLYVDHKNEYFTTRFGKQNWVDAAGRETFASGTDVFLASGVASGYKAAFGSDYRYGVSFIGKLAETNIITLALSNPNQDMSDAPATGDSSNNTGLAMGAYYNGQFFDKAFQPTLGYTVAKQNGNLDAATPTKEADFTVMSAGFRSEFAGLTLDADYKILDRESTLTAATGNASSTKSVYSMLSYAMGEFTPIAYYINDRFTGNAANSGFKRDAFAAGVYWKPFQDVNFRYHLMYTNDVKKFDTSSAASASKITDDRFWLGFKIDV